jgi:hypothetical protein
MFNTVLRGVLATSIAMALFGKIEAGRRGMYDNFHRAVYQGQVEASIKPVQVISRSMSPLLVMSASAVTMIPVITTLISAPCEGSGSGGQ